MLNKKPMIILINSEDCAGKILKSKIITDKFNIFSANTGKEGLKLIFSKKPDLVISDVSMPKGDIFYILKQMKLNLETKNIPVVALTTLCSAEDKKEVENQGVCGYLLEHECSPQKLVKKIDKIIRDCRQ